MGQRSLPLISCLCPTYNRAPSHLHLLGEAVEAFLRQGYPNKELLVLNDTPGQNLVCFAEGVRIVNMTIRYANLSEKLRDCMRLARGSLFCRWDDDDISLPWRLSLSVQRLGDKLEWRPENHWFDNGGRIEKETCHPGNTHIMAIWRRELAEQMPIYPANVSCASDQDFNQQLAKAGINAAGELLLPHEIFYLYRWAVSPTHLSGVAGEGGWDAAGTKKVVSGTFEIIPRWREDHTARAIRASQDGYETGRLTAVPLRG